MPRIDLEHSFSLLELESPKRLVDLCPGVRDVSWRELHPDEIHVLLVTLRFLEALRDRGLVHEMTIPAERKIPHNIPYFLFRRVSVEHEECVPAVINDAMWSLRHRGAGMRDRVLAVAS